MKNIVLTRVDDRLIHGQVMTAWVQHCKGNVIEIIDDEVAQDDFLKLVTTSTAPENIQVRVDTLEDAVKFLQADAKDQRVIILVKTPQVIADLLKRGISIAQVDVGGMAQRKDRTQLYRNIAASPKERQVFQEIIAAGTYVMVQVIPSDKAVNITQYL